MLSLGPSLTSVHDYWKNHSFYYMELVSKVMSLLLKKMLAILLQLKIKKIKIIRTKSLQMVTAAMKLKDACSLEEKL